MRQLHDRTPEQDGSQRPYQGLFDWLDKAGTLILANLLWVFTSIFVVTMPMATAGLFNSMARWARGTPTEVFYDFTSGARQHWRKATVVGVIDAVLTGLILVNFSIFPRMNMSQPITLLSQGVTMFVALTAFMTNLYLWPLMVMFEDMALRRLVDNAVRLVFIHPAWSFFMIVLALLPFAVSLFLPVGVFVVASFSSAALIVSWAAWRIIQRYVPAEETKPDEDITT